MELVGLAVSQATGDVFEGVVFTFADWVAVRASNGSIRISAMAATVFGVLVGTSLGRLE